MQKVEILQKLEKVKSVHNLCGHFDVSSSVIYDIKQCDKLMKFFAESDMNMGITECRTMQRARLADLDKLVYECIST